jgi:hypothetical protein
MKRIIIEMTPFIFEDGNTYYFQIDKRDSTNDYHDLFVYEKQVEKRFWGNKENFICLNSDKPELIEVRLDTHNIKARIKKILIAAKAKHQLTDWDGFVGDVPDDVKKSLKREGKLKNILGE